jgi:hypothetical protein
MFADLNGDRIINDADKPVNGYSRLQSIQNVYIASADFAPTYQPKPKSVAVIEPRKLHTIWKE